MDKLQWAEKHITASSHSEDVHDEYSVGYVAWCLVLEAAESNLLLSEELRQQIVPLAVSHVKAQGFEERDHEGFFYAWVRWLQFTKVRSQFAEMPFIPEPVYRPLGPQRVAKQKRKAMQFHQKAVLEHQSEGGQL